MSEGQIYNSKNEAGVQVLKIVGAFNKSTIPHLQKICNSVAKQRDTKGVLIDVREVSTIDSAAFACMIQFIKDHTARGVAIGMINLKEQEKSFLEILKVDRALRVFQKESEAIAVLSKKE